jgi:hypothetical protein
MNSEANPGFCIPVLILASADTMQRMAASRGEIVFTETKGLIRLFGAVPEYVSRDESEAMEMWAFDHISTLLSCRGELSKYGIRSGVFRGAERSADPSALLVARE